MVKEYLILWDEYIIYKDGRIYSKYYKKMLKGYVDEDGYVVTSLKCIDGKRRMFKWHRIIWTYFNGAIPEGYQINHINEDKTDNRLCNLNLMTPKENTNWGTAIQRRAAKRRSVPQPFLIERNKRLFSKTVIAVDSENKIVLEFTSTKEAGRQGFNQGAVAACCRNCYHRQGNNIYKNLRWYYLEDYLKMKGVA